MSLKRKKKNARLRKRHDDKGKIAKIPKRPGGGREMSFRGVVFFSTLTTSRARAPSEERRNRTHECSKGKHQNRPSRTLMPCEYSPSRLALYPSR